MKALVPAALAYDSRCCLSAASPSVNSAHQIIKEMEVASCISAGGIKPNFNMYYA